MAMMLWLDSKSFKIIAQQVEKIGQIFDYQPYTFKTVENNKIVCIKLNLRL